jgi:hypothetical protein
MAPPISVLWAAGRIALIVAGSVRRALNGNGRKCLEAYRANEARHLIVGSLSSSHPASA